MYSVRIGQEIRLDDGNYVITGLNRGNLKLKNVDDREYCVLHITELVQRMTDIPGGAGTTDYADPAILDTISDKERKHIDLLALHLRELIDGTPPTPDTEPRPEYDPARFSLAERIDLKVKELNSLGCSCSARTLRRKLDAYREAGEAGLIDRRGSRRDDPFRKLDPRVRDALISVIAAERDSSTGSGERFSLRLEKRLLRDYPGQDVKVPPRTSLWRYEAFLGKNKYAFGNAANRRSAANAPARMYSSRPPIMPGHEVQVDTSDFDILVLDDDGKSQRVKLVIFLDKATRSIISTGIRRVATKGFDLSCMLAQCVVPRPLRPAVAAFNEFELAEMPWAAGLSSEEVGKYDTTRPFIVPARIVTDNGSDYLSTTFRSACQGLGISITECSIRTPTDKPNVERAFDAIKTLFAQYLPGYTGGEVSRRGKSPEKDAGLLDIYTLAELFERWVTVIWQNRPQDGLRDPLCPGVVHTPNSMYMAMFDATGFVPIPLTAADYIAMMPIEYRTIQMDGIQIQYRRYDSPDLQRYRLSPSYVTGHKRKWAVRTDPNNPAAVWVQDPEDQSWIQCDWMNQDAFGKPFSAEFRQKARDVAAELGVKGDLQSGRVIEKVLRATRTEKAKTRAAEQRQAAAQKLAHDAGMPDLVVRRPDLLAPSESPDIEVPTVGIFDPNQEYL
ncbi:Mu transposase C-terminal domain-containing protein [Arthrobacter sp. NPDC093139]|uniref:Mu transposase C-terminal domain-containing protein n=1 Tax=Arthrobacter sp. NPDC093139 TaxID=3363945 RepID=UPI00382FA423